MSQAVSHLFMYSPGNRNDQVVNTLKELRYPWKH
jgi:hypothetical protein